MALNPNDPVVKGSAPFVDSKGCLSREGRYFLMGLQSTGGQIDSSSELAAILLAASVQPSVIESLQQQLNALQIQVAMVQPPEVILSIAQQTYSAVSSPFTPGATPTDVFTITGVAGKTVKIKRLWISTTQVPGAGSWNQWFLVQRSTANTIGTSAAVTAVKHDSNNEAASAIALQYTANPTLGTLVGKLWSGQVNSPAPLVGGVAGEIVLTIDWEKEGAQPPTLRSASEVLAWNFGGAALPVGLTVIAGVEWTEE